MSDGERPEHVGRASDEICPRCDLRAYSAGQLASLAARAEGVDGVVAGRIAEKVRLGIYPGKGCSG